MGLSKQDSLCIKGVAILYMLFHHLFLDESRFAAYSVSFFPFSQEFIVSIGFMLKICVSIFAFISGYGLLKSVSVIKLSKRNAEAWCFKRLLKTMSGYYFIYIFALIVTQAIDRLPQKTYFSDGSIKGLIYLLTDFLGVHGLFSTPTLNSTWWYMSAAILYIALVPIIYTISKKTGYMPVVIVVIALPRILNVGYPGGINPYTFILPMLFGMIFAEYDAFERISDILSHKKALSSAAAFIIFSGGIVLFYFISVYIRHYEAWELEYGIAPLFHICFLRYFIVRIPVVKNILAFLGKLSMTIFLSHSFIRYTYLGDLVYSPSNFLEIYALLLVLSVALALALDTVKRLIKYDKLFDKYITEKITSKILINKEK